MQLKAQAYFTKKLKMTTVWQNHKHGRILNGMSILVKATPAPKPRTKESRQMAILLTGIFVVFALTQLFTLEEFLELIPAMALPFGDVITHMLAPLIIVAEIFALPFLLGMAVSPAFRWLSMVLGWLVAGLWTFISFWVALTRPAVETVGYLGTLVPLVPGWWVVSVSLALCILVAWATWGLWPGSRTKN